MNRIIPALILLYISVPLLVPAQQIRASPDSAIKTGVDTLPLSDIDIPVKINLKALYRILENKVDTVYHSPGWPLAYYQPSCDTRYMYRFRRGHLRLTALGNAMTMEFTGYYQIQASQRACGGNVPYTLWTPPCSCGTGKEGARRVNVGFNTRFNLRPNYTIQAKVTRQPSIPIDQCNVCFWGQNITTQVMNAINAQMDTAGWGIQDTLDHLNLRPQFQQLWQKLWGTYRLYNVGYLQLRPERLRVSQLMARGDTLYLSVGISGRPMISLAPLKDTVTPVPDLSDFTPRHGFTIYLDAKLNYDSLAALLNAQLDKQAFTIDKRNITIEKCFLSPLDREHISLGFQFSGDQSGTLYLSGTPVLDTAKGMLDISDLDYRLETNSMLMRTASWLFNRKILKELKTYTHFPVKDYMDSLRVKASTQLSQPVISGIRTEGRLDKITLLRMIIDADNIGLRCEATGELDVMVDQVTW